MYNDTETVEEDWTDGDSVGVGRGTDVDDVVGLSVVIVEGFSIVIEDWIGFKIVPVFVYQAS